MADETLSLAPHTTDSGIEEFADPRSVTQRLSDKVFRRVKLEEVAMFTSQLATMLETGVPMCEALTALVKEVRSRAFRACLVQVTAEFQQGRSLVEAMSRHRYAFSPFFLSMVEVGMESGEMPRVLRDTANQLERSLDLRKNVAGAIAYPCVVACLGVVAAILAVTVLIPKIEEQYKSLAKGKELPGATQVLLSLSATVREHYVLTTTGTLSLAFGVMYLLTTRRGRMIFDRWVVHVWVFGYFMRAAVLARVCHAFGLLLSTGVPIVRSLRIAATTAGNAYFVEELNRCGAAIERGGGAAVSFGACGDMPDTLVQMIAAGEETGELPTLLDKVSQFYHARAAHAARVVSRILEPLLLVIVAIGIGCLVYALMMPIYQLSQGLGEDT